MSSQSKKHRRKYKGVPWIKTKYSLRYRRCLALSKLPTAAIAAAGAARITAIRFSQAAQAEKALGIAMALIDTQRAMLKAAKDMKCRK